MEGVSKNLQFWLNGEDSAMNIMCHSKLPNLECALQEKSNVWKRLGLRRPFWTTSEKMASLVASVPAELASVGLALWLWATSRVRMGLWWPVLCPLPVFRELQSPLWKVLGKSFTQSRTCCMLAMPLSVGFVLQAWLVTATSSHLFIPCWRLCLRLDSLLVARVQTLRTWDMVCRGIFAGALVIAQS